MDKKVKHILESLGVLLAAGAMLWNLGNIVQRKDSDHKYYDFFAQKEDFDVLLLGTSHVINGVFPMELWKDYGIVSYNFGGHDNMVATTYWVMENALTYTTPKLVVVDMARIDRENKASESISYLHLSFDAFPFTLTKCRAVMDLLDDPVIEEKIEAGIITESEKRGPMGLLWDFSVYHPRWADLAEDDFAMEPRVEKGAESRIAVATPQPADQTPIEKPLGDTINQQYLRRLIERCQDMGIEVLLTYIPAPPTPYLRQEAERGAKIAAEYGVDCINFLDMDVVDYDTDMYDYGHLNPSGARKITDHLGRYIAERYGIPDRRQDPAYSGWYEDYEAYARFKESNLQQQKRLDTYLMLLADKNYDFVFLLKDKELFKDGLYNALLENLGIDTAALTGTGGWLITRQGGQPAQIWPADKHGETLHTALGTVCLQGGAATLDGVQCLAAPAEDENAGLRIAVLAAEDHRLADAVDFDLTLCVPLR